MQETDFLGKKTAASNRTSIELFTLFVQPDLSCFGLILLDKIKKVFCREAVGGWI